MHELGLVDNTLILSTFLIILGSFCAEDFTDIAD